jgi:tetratricopeptide (TPR) repeat protein
VGRRLTGALIAVSTLLSVALAVAVNVATGGTLPGPLAGSEWAAWPVVALLAVATVVVAVWQLALSSGDPAQTASPPGLRAGLPAAPAARSASAAPPLRPAELPGYVGAFTGRAEVFAKLAAVVPEHSRTGPGEPVILTISGPAGVGKTSLGLRLAHHLSARHPDGQLWVEMRGASAEPADPDEALRRLLLVFGVSADSVPEDVDARRALYRSVLADRRVLVFADDAGSAEQVRPLTPGAQGCLLLVTSRRELFMNATASCRLDVLDEDAAVQLLALTSGPDRVANEPEAARAIVNRCGRLPLAVRIAGYRLQARPTWTLAYLGERLADERRRLDELRLGDRDVRSSFALSYADSDEVARRLFRRLALLGHAEFGPGAAAALLGADATREEATATLERLADTNLVEVLAPGRYRLHDLLRVFANEQLAAEEPPRERRDAAHRMLVRYVDLAQTAVRELTSPDQTGDDRRKALGWLGRQRAVLVAAVRRGADLGEPEQARTLAAALSPYLARSGYPVDLATVSMIAADLARRGGDVGGEAAALSFLGEASRMRSAYDEAFAQFAASRALFERMGNSKAAAVMQMRLGDAYRETGRYEEAERNYEEALAVATEHGATSTQVSIHLGLGVLRLMQGRLDEGAAVTEAAVRLLETDPAAAGRQDSKAWGLLTLGSIRSRQRRFAEADALHTEALAGFREVGNRYGQAYALRNLGISALEQGRPAEAKQRYDAALELFTEIGNIQGQQEVEQDIAALRAGSPRP